MSSIKRRISALEEKSSPLTGPFQITLVVGPTLTKSEAEARNAQFAATWRPGAPVTCIEMIGVLPEAEIITFPSHEGSY